MLSRRKWSILSSIIVNPADTWTQGRGPSIPFASTGLSVRRGAAGHCFRVILLPADD